MAEHSPSELKVVGLSPVGRFVVRLGFVHSKESECHFALTSLCVAETSGFLWILADFQ